jgi:hypothetical protein
VGLARKNGYRVDERIAAQQVKVNAVYLEHQRDALHQSFFPGQAGSEAFGDVFGPGVLGYLMVGLDAEHYQPDLDTDAAAMYLKSRQQLNGEWAYPEADTRQPVCLDYIGQTAFCMRALQLYTPKTDRAEYEKAVQLAASWLVKATPKTDEDRVWRLQGLAWAGRDKDAAAKAMRELAGGAEARRRLGADGIIGKRRLRNRQGAGGPAGGGHAGLRPGLPARRTVPVEQPDGGRLVERENACAGISTVFRNRISARRGSIHFRGRDQLGDHGVDAGFGEIRREDGNGGASGMKLQEITPLRTA